MNLTVTGNESTASISHNDEENPIAEDSAIHSYESYLKQQRRLKSLRLHNSQAHLAEEDMEEDRLHQDEINRSTRKRLEVMSIIGRRQAFVIESAEWQSALKTTAGDDDLHHATDDHPSIPFYAHPVQRQRWGDEQVLPHINWGDLFFDLFYVAAAYNLGSLLISALDSVQWPRGVVYFVGIFGSLYNMWENAVNYQARYTVVDYAHRLFEVVRFLIVAIAVLHIKPIEFLSNPESIETFCLVLSLLLESIMHLGICLELYLRAEGDRIAIQNHTRRKITYGSLPASLVYLAATIISAVLYWNGKDDRPNRLLADEYGTEKGSAAGYAADDGDINWNIADLPLALCFAAYVFNAFYTGFRKLRLSNQNNIEDMRDHFVPSNIDYMIHRYGEWIMLMFGESILSLLIVETTESAQYYVAAGFGILTVIVLQGIKFESEPVHADAHALWRNIRGQMAFVYTIQLLSMSLIAFGVSFKVFLTMLKQEEDKPYDDKSNRLLAPTPAVEENAAAALYCVSLSVVLVALELMLLTHGGAKHNWNLLFRSKENRSLNWPLVMLTATKLGLILFAATLSQWQTNPTALTAIGFVVVASLAWSRILGWGLVHKRKEIKQAVRTSIEKIKKPSRSCATSQHNDKCCSHQFGQSLPSRRKRSKAMKSSELEECAESASEIASEASYSQTSFLASILDTSFDAIVVTDDYGLIKEANETAVTMFGYDSVSDLVGESVSILVGAQHARVHDQYIKKFRDEGRSSIILGKQRVSFARCKDGSEFPCTIGIKKIPNSNFMVAYIRDMTPTHRKKDS